MGNASRATVRLHRAVNITADRLRWFEPLEQRTLMCAEGASPLTNDPVQIAILEAHDHHGTEWHVNAEDLSAAERAVLDPHFILDHRPIPAEHFQAQRTPGGADAVTEVLPDFFPAMSGSSSIDQTSQAGRTLLRFGTQVNNMGMGPGTLISGTATQAVPAGMPFTSWVNADGSQNVVQNIYSWNNTSNSFTLTRQRPAGKFVYHSGHSHFHYEGYANYTLMTRNADGSVGAPATRSDGTVVEGAKIGFCLINVNSSFTLPQGGSSTSIASYGATGQPSTGCGFLQGVNVGRADVYSSGLEGQWIDVTGVPNGQYFVRITLDGQNTLQESDESNNAKDFLVTVSGATGGGGIARDRFDNPTRNDTLATATDLGEEGVESITGLTLESGIDRDYFEFTATSTGSYQTSVTYANGDVNLYLYDSAGNEIAQATNPTAGSTSSPFTEGFTTSFVKGQTYYVKALTYNSTVSSNYAINFKVLPTVDYTPSIAKIGETRPEPAEFLVHRNGPTTGPLTVAFTLGGTATRNSDYTLTLPDGSQLGSSIVFGDLQSDVHILVTPINDQVAEGPETITLAINSTAAFISGASSRTITIVEAGAGPGGGRVDNPRIDPNARGTRVPTLDGLFNSGTSILGASNGDDRGDSLLISSL